MFFDDVVLILKIYCLLRQLILHDKNSKIILMIIYIYIIVSMSIS